MPVPRFEVPTGVIDGVNKVFYVSTPYQPGTTALFINGQLKRADYDDGWFETNPATGEVTLKEAPEVTDFSDVVQIFFIDTSPYLPTSVLRGIEGTITAVTEIEGRLRIYNG